MHYLAYQLDSASREALLRQFPPSFPVVKADHVTIAINLPSDAPAPAHSEPATAIELLALCRGNGIEAFRVRVNGSLIRPDGLPWHLTWSLDDQQTAPSDWARLMNRPEGETLSALYAGALVASMAGDALPQPITLWLRPILASSSRPAAIAPP